MNNEKLNSIVTQVQGLLAIAKDKDDSEGYAAMMLAQRLMQKYHLSENDTKKRKDDMYKQLLFDKKQTKVIQGLASTIAVNFACIIIDDSFNIANYRITKMYLYGKKSDVKIAIELIELAINTANYKAKQYIDNWYDEQGCSRKRAYTTKLKHNYMVGYIIGLKQAFSKQATERGLLVTNKEARAAYYAAHKGAKNKGLRFEYNRDNAYKKGTTDGARFSDHKRLG